MNNSVQHNLDQIAMEFQEAGVSNFENDKARIYPNPAGESVTLEVLGKEFDKARVDFVNLSGQIVFSQNIEMSVTKFDISFLPDGFYFVQFQTDDIVLIIKFVKQ
jgi:hypothetical protein